MSNISLRLAFDYLGIDSVMTGDGDRYVIGEMQTWNQSHDDMQGSIPSLS